MEFSVEIVKIKIQVILEGLKNLKKITKFFFNLIRKVNLSKEGRNEGRGHGNIMGAPHSLSV